MRQIYLDVLSIVHDMNLSDLNVAVFHYWLVSYRGGERVLSQILKIFPNADIYTLFADPDICRTHFDGHQIYSSFLDKKYLRSKYKPLFPLYPLAVRSLGMQKKYDLIVSSESGPIKGIVNRNRIPHICYIHSPMRYCWGKTDDYLKTIPRLLRPTVSHLFKKLKRWDYGTRNAPDHYIANSKNVKKRVLDYYQRDAEVIHPPVEDVYFTPPLHYERKKYYLYLGAITPYKGIDLAINAFNLNGKPFIIASRKKELVGLKKKVKSNIQLVANFSEHDKIRLFSNATALIFPAEEDFGIVPVEAMACGTPVIALKKGGAMETVIEKRDHINESTGIFFSEASESSLNHAINFFESVRDEFSPDFIRRHVEKFRERRFIDQFSHAVHRFLATD